MNLNTAQRTVLVEDIAADPTLGQLPKTLDNAFVVSAAYNLAATPDYKVWKTSIAFGSLLALPGFAWDRVDNLSVGKSRILEFMMRAQAINPSMSNIRAGFAACFAAAGDALTLAAILAECKRSATRAEKIFSTGSGTDLSPSVMGAGAEGSLSPQDIALAWGI